MTSTFHYELKIPKDRIAVLIGKKGDIKQRIEIETKISLDIDSKEADIVLSGDDGLGLYVAKEIVKAIGRGFNPDIAFLLLKPDVGLEVISLEQFAPTKNAQIRLRGRLIGTSGKARGAIEQLTGAFICVYGKTVSIVGEVLALSHARKAVEMLLTGSPHRNVYKWLEKQKKMSRHMVV